MTIFDSFKEYIGLGLQHYFDNFEDGEISSSDLLKYLNHYKNETFILKKIKKKLEVNPLSFIFNNNVTCKLNYAPSQLDYLIKNGNLMQVDKNGWSPLMLALRNNKEEKLNLSSEQWDHLIKNSNLMQVDKDGWSPLMLALEYNKKEELNLSSEQWDYLIKNSNLMQVDKNGWSPLMMAIRNNKEDELNLSSEQLDYLIKNSNLIELKEDGWSPLMLALECNKKEELNLSSEQWDYLIKNSNLIEVKEDGWSPLMMAIRNNKEDELNLSSEQWHYLIENTSEEIIKNKVVNWGATTLLCYLSGFSSGVYLTANDFDLLLKKSDLSYTNATSNGKNWIVSYLERKFDKKLPTTDYSLSKIFEESIKDQGLLMFTIESFFSENKKSYFSLNSDHFDYLIGHIDFTKQNSTKLLKSYLFNKKEQGLNISDEALSLLIKNVSCDMELFKELLDKKNPLNLNEKQIDNLNSLKEEKLNNLHLTLDNIFVLLTDKIRGTKEFDLSFYDERQDLFEKQFTEILGSINKKDNDTVQKLIKFVSEFKEKEVCKLIEILEPINKEISLLIDSYLEKRSLPNPKISEIREKFKDINTNYLKNIRAVA